MATQQVPHHYTLEEYLELERVAEYRSEYCSGTIYAMSGGSELHSRLSARMVTLLVTRLAGSRVYDCNLKIFIEAANQGVYPDAMAICGEPEFWGGRRVSSPIPPSWWKCFRLPLNATTGPLRFRSIE